MEAKNITYEKVITREKIKNLNKSWWGKGAMRSWVFTRVLVSDAAYVYLLRSEDQKQHWEVVKRKVFTKYKHSSKGIVAIRFEKYPETRDFGVYGWCMDTYKSAEAKFNKLSGLEVLE